MPAPRFIAYDRMAATLVAMFGEGGVIRSPLRFAAEGDLVGLAIGYLATRFGGEGLPRRSDAGDSKRVPSRSAP